MERIVPKTFVLVLSLFINSVESFSQQTPLYTQYFLNPFLYNPASAGIAETPQAWFLYRKQWAGIDGAPETQVFTLDGTLEKHPVGLGLTLFNDVTNIIGRTSGGLSASYEAQLSAEQRLRFGMSLMAIRNRIFFDRIHAEDVSDPNLLTVVDQRTAFEGNAGLIYMFKKLQFSFSAEQLFQSSVLYRNEALFKTLDYTFVRHYYTALNYEFTANSDLSVKPMLLIRTIQGLPSQLDVGTLVSYKQLAWANLSYRHKIGGGISVGFALDEQFLFGYTYEFPTSDLNILGSITHEFMLGLRLKKPVDSPVTRQKNTELKSLERQNAVQYEKIDALQQQNERVTEQLQVTQNQLEEQSEELRLLREIVGGYEEELSKAIIKLQASPADTLSESSGPFYLVVGSLRTLENAKLLQRIMKREAGLDTRIVQSASGSWYFIYTRELKSFSEGSALIEELLNSPARPYIIGNPWIYKWEKR